MHEKNDIRTKNVYVKTLMKLTLVRLFPNIFHRKGKTVKYTTIIIIFYLLIKITLRNNFFLLFLKIFLFVFVTSELLHMLSLTQILSK